MKPNLVAQNAALSACEKAKQWQRALILLEQLPEKGLTADDVSAYVMSKGVVQGLSKNLLMLFEKVLMLTPKT